MRSLNVHGLEGLDSTIVICKAYYLSYFIVLLLQCGTFGRSYKQTSSILFLEPLLVIETILVLAVKV